MPSLSRVSYAILGIGVFSYFCFKAYDSFVLPSNQTKKHHEDLEQKNKDDRVHIDASHDRSKTNEINLTENKLPQRDRILTQQAPKTNQKNALQNIEKLLIDAYGDYSYLKAPRYEDSNDDIKRQFLRFWELGEGNKLFETISKYTKPLDVKSNTNDADIYRDFLGKWRGDYITENVRDADVGSYYIAEFTDKGVEVYLGGANGRIYLKSSSAIGSKEIVTATSYKIPKNIIFYLNAKPESGYRHKIVMSLFISESRDYIIGNLYNTNQTLDAPNYVLSDHLVFQRISNF
jgi:hypothetical protein